MKCDGTRAESRFRLSAKRTSLFKSPGASVQSTTDSRGVRISGSNAGYNMFRGSVKGTGYPLHSPVSPFTSSAVRHRVPSHSNWNLTEVHLRLLLTSTPNGRQVVNFTPRQTHPREKNLGTQYTGGCACSTAGLDGFGEGKISCPCRQSNPGLSRP